jgi:hypothetical protein
VIDALASEGELFAPYIFEAASTTICNDAFKLIFIYSKYPFTFAKFAEYFVRENPFTSVKIAEYFVTKKGSNSGIARWTHRPHWPQPSRQSYWPILWPY